MDRNTQKEHPLTEPKGSLSARRAWIEIGLLGWLRTLEVTVALRKESVDRNASKPRRVLKCDKSLSARRAWIEM